MACTRKNRGRIRAQQRQGKTGFSYDNGVGVGCFFGLVRGGLVCGFVSGGAVFLLVTASKWRGILVVGCG